LSKCPSKSGTFGVTFEGSLSKMSFKSIENWQGPENDPSESGPQRVKRGHLRSKEAILTLFRGPYLGRCSERVEK
jgi:hypothetical protein